MEPIRLLNLGLVPSYRSQTIYHAIGHAMTEDTPDTIILVSPSNPYVCIGYHQELEEEVDLDYCKRSGIPVYRREVGGGAVYLDSGQVFVQWVFQPGRLPVDLEEKFAFYIKTFVDTYRSFGIEAYQRPINDIHVSGKKIGGTGAVQLGQSDVIVGSLMFTFAKRTMANVLKVSSEKMRDKIVESLDQYMVTMSDLLHPLPPVEVVTSAYISACENILGRRILHGSVTAKEEAAAVEWDSIVQSAEWLNQRGGIKKTGVKIHEDIRVVGGATKAPGGLIRVAAVLEDGRINKISVSGDFTMFPSTGVAFIEDSLQGVEIGQEVLHRKIAEVYQNHNLKSPGVAPEHFAEAIHAAVLGKP